MREKGEQGETEQVIDCGHSGRNQPKVEEEDVL